MRYDLAGDGPPLVLWIIHRALREWIDLELKQGADGEEQDDEDDDEEDDADEDEEPKLKYQRPMWRSYWILPQRND